MKIVKSVLSKVENYAWFGDYFQTIRFRLGQQVRVSWSLKDPATDIPHFVSSLVSVTIVYEREGESKSMM